MFLLVLNPLPYFEAEYCLFCGRRRVTVARYRMICLVLLENNGIQWPSRVNTCQIDYGYMCIWTECQTNVRRNRLTFVVPETRKFHRKRSSYFFCTARGCLVQTVWFYLLSCCSFTSEIMLSQRKAQRFPQRQRVAVPLKRTLFAYGGVKSNQPRSIDLN